MLFKLRRADHQENNAFAFLGALGVLAVILIF
jgi:hypothetical protein